MCIIRMIICVLAQLAPGEIWDVLKKVNLEVVKDKADEVRLRYQRRG